MKTVTLILPLEATTVSDSRIDSSSDTIATAGATAAAAERQWSNSGVIAVRLCSDSSDSSDSGATMER